MKRTLLFLAVLLLAVSPAYPKVVGISGGTTATTSGSTTAGWKGVTFIFSSDFTGTVAGIAFTGADYSYSPPVQAGDTLAAIAYVVTTGNIRIIPVK